MVSHLSIVIITKGNADDDDDDKNEKYCKVIRMLWRKLSRCLEGLTE
jgi:hypothetical protein